MALRYCIFDNDKTTKDFKMYITDKKMKAVPNVEINELNVGSRDGVLPIKTKIGKNTFKLTIQFFEKPKDAYNLIRDFINFLNPKKGIRKIVFSDEIDKCRYAILSNANEIDYFYSQYLTLGSFDLDFTMYDPYTYSQYTKKFYYNGKNGATAKIINNGGDSCFLKMFIYAPKGVESKKYEEDNPKITYYGEWETYKTSYFSGGASKFASSTGSSATLTFYGTGIKLFGLKSAGKGLANIYIDDILVDKVDCYAESEQWSELLYSNANLENQVHTIKVEVSGEKNDNSVGYQINIDYFQVTSSSIPSDVKPLEINGETYSYADVPTIEDVKVYINDTYIGYNSQISPTDELVIDTEEFTMELNNMNNLKHWDGDFPILDPGENEIKVTDKNNSGALVIFEFVERWL